MPTIQYLDRDSISHNMTAYLDSKQAESDLFAWQYVCSRLFKVSDVAPSEFRFIGDLKKDETIQGSLYTEYEQRKANSLDINAFTYSREMQSINEKQIVPELFEKDYLMLDLLLTQKVIKENGQEHVSEYGKKLINFVESLHNKDIKEIEININLVNEIIETEQKNISNHYSRIRKIENELNEAETLIKYRLRDISDYEKENQRNLENSQYISDSEQYSPDNIKLLKRRREYTEKSMGIIDKLQLRVFQFLGKNTNHFYNDNLEKLEMALQNKISEKAKEFEDKSKILDEKKQQAQQEIDENIAKQEELKQALQAIKSIEYLSLGNEYLDDNHIRDVKRIVKDNNTVFLHSISTEYGFQPYENSPLVKGVTFKDKVDQIRCFNPSLSCSSFKLDSGTQLNDFTAPMGVIVTGGHVLSAASSDDGTKPSENGEREKRYVSSEKITEIINNRTKTTVYDEFTITQTKVSGLYINYDRIQREHKDYLSNEKKHCLVGTLKTLLNYQNEDRKIPIMIIKDGNLHTITPKDNFYELASEFLEKEKKANYRVRNMNEMNEEFLMKACYISEKKSIDDIVLNNVELDDEQKFRRGEKLIKNYKSEYQQMIIDKVNNFKTNLTFLREKFSDNSERAKLKIS